jgi:hypothetical protein
MVVESFKSSPNGSARKQDIIYEYHCFGGEVTWDVGGGRKNHGTEAEVIAVHRNIHCSIEHSV